jgi:hypothetical protein
VKRVLLCLAILLLFGLIGCVKHELLMPSPDVLGFAYCSPSGPIGFVNIRTINTFDYKPTVLHEMRHMEQIKRFANCGDFDAWRVRGDNNARIEAEAYCEQVRIEAPLFGRMYAIAKYAEWLSSGYPQFKLTPKTAASLIAEYC